MQLVSFTGADDVVDPKTLAAYSKLFPFIEWAILYFPEKAGTVRNPSPSWREMFLSYDLQSAAHLCGEEVFRKLMDPIASAQIIGDLRRYRRVQVNINARHKVFSDDEVLMVWRRLLDTGRPIILQYHEDSAALIEAFMAANQDRKDQLHLLFDSSKGRGTLPDTYQSPMTMAGLCGYAGGLSPDTVSSAMAGIVAAVGAQNFWIDMESGIRTENQLDFDKVIAILRAVSRHVHRTTPTPAWIKEKTARKTKLQQMNKTSDGDEVYFGSGFSLKRENGLTPNGNEMNGRWVLRDDRGFMLDFDRYRNDLADRYNLKLIESSS